MTAIATVVFLFSKFLEGAWVVVVAVPTFILLFVRIHAYYKSAAHDLGIGSAQEKPEARQSLVIVPIISVSRLTVHAISEALSFSQDVVAVTVVLNDGGESEDRARTLSRTGPRGTRASSCEYSTPTTRPSWNRSSRSSTSCELTMTGRSSCSSPWSSRTACAIACSTIRSTLCSLRHYGPALTSWSHESSCRWGVGEPARSDRACPDRGRSDRGVGSTFVIVKVVEIAIGK